MCSVVNVTKCQHSYLIKVIALCILMYTWKFRKHDSLALLLAGQLSSKKKKKTIWRWIKYSRLGRALFPSEIRFTIQKQTPWPLNWLGNFQTGKGEINQVMTGNNGTYIKMIKMTFFMHHITTLSTILILTTLP